MTRSNLAAALVGLTGLLLSFNANAATEISCKGFVSFQDGTMEGNSTVTVRKTDGDDQHWVVNDFIDAGTDLSTDSTTLKLNTYGLIACKGASIDYDSSTKTMTFRYKYGSGILGGGCQKTRGTFTNCTEK